MPETIVQLTVSEADLVALAGRMAAVLVAGDCVALWGDLGAGKTTFARALIRALVGDADLEVPSPTFALRQDYASDRAAVVHFDLYRIAEPRDLDELGFDDAPARAITVVEWPERAGDRVPPNAIGVYLRDGPTAGVRDVTITVADVDRQRIAAVFQ